MAVPSQQCCRMKLFMSIINYNEETLQYISVVNEFRRWKRRWFLQRQTELQKLRDIKERADQINLKFDHVKNSKNKGKAFREYLWSGLTQVTAETRAQELQKKLGTTLKGCLRGLEELQSLLEAVEKLAVTSLFIFDDQNPLCLLPAGISRAAVRSVITAARTTCPLLVNFKKDTAELFLPSLVNVEALANELEKFMQVSEDICEKMGIRDETAKLSKASRDLSPDTMKSMLEHLRELNKLRINEDFRLTFLFNDYSVGFVDLFSERRARMQEFFGQLEEAAVQLDKMKKVSSISTLTGSSVGLAGGVLSITGLAIAPLTAGASLICTLVGVGLGMISGVHSITTGVTEFVVNTHEGKKINSIFQTFMEDVEVLLTYLNQVASSTVPTVTPDEVDTAVSVGKIVVKAGCIAKGIDAMVDGASALKILKSEDVIESTSRAALQEARAAGNLPNVASDLADFGNIAKGTPLALSKSARAGFITLNSIFVGIDLLFICKETVSLAKGIKSDVSETVRDRAKLWKSEVDSWQRIHDSLCKGARHFQQGSRILEKPFYPV
ncbi:hypothetical protein GN956_G1903 [Arapaima gigas]